MKKTLIITLSTLLCCACNNQKTAGIDPANLDTSVSPGEDFYTYANGGWIKNNPLKPEFARYGSFDILGENNQIRLNELFDGMAKKTNVKGSDEQKIADLYKLGLDSVRLNAEGAAPVLPYLAELEEVEDLEDFAEASAKIGKRNVSSIFGCYVASDLANSSMNAFYIGEDGLAMGNRDYYLLPEHQGLRDGYKAYLEKIFTLAAYGDPAKIASDAFEVEMAIAVPFWSMVQQRDVAAQYNPMTVGELTKKYPNLYFDEYLDELDMEDKLDTVIVEQPSYLQAINGLVVKLGAEKLRHYLQAKVLSDATSSLSDDFQKASFDFFYAQMSGVKEQKPRWKRAMAVPNFALGEAVGKMYVKKYFPEKDKARVLAMVRNIQTSLSEHIAALDWMGEATKAKAQEKLAAFTVKIGYPDKWKDYGSLEIDPEDSYLENCYRVSEWYTEDNLSKAGKPVDKDEWHMSPQTVNAYYNPTTNEICFPAGILQPPFYYHNADDPVNYGAIGAVISHEMTHGFDDQGRLFDKDGNMNNWWTEEDSKTFKEKTQVLVKQYGEIEVLPGVFANGEATLGENIADQGGVSISYSAMRKAIEGKENPLIDGFTPDQRFFLAFAAVWANNITDAEIQRRTLQDVHSLGINRTNATLRNFGSFFDAFGIKEGDKMYRPENERIMIW